jgi:hypothetical protein
MFKIMIFLPDYNATAKWGWQHKYSAKTRQAGHTNEQFIYSQLSMVGSYQISAIFICIAIDS